ncbi:MAG: DoxX family protein [Bacteroidota bacterium]
MIFRILLGIGLFLKGIDYIRNKSLIRNAFTDSKSLQDYFWLQTLIPWLNLLCGVFIIIGLFTRLAAFIQIPILVGAIVFVNAKKGMFAGDSELLLSVAILLLLIIFSIKGSGPVSWDKWIKKDKDNF